MYGATGIGTSSGVVGGAALASGSMVLLLVAAALAMAAGVVYLRLRKRTAAHQRQ